MTRPTPPLYLNDEPLTVDDLVERWRSYEEPLAREELEWFTRPRTPRVVMVGRCVVAGVAITIATTLPGLLRTVGGA